MNTQILNIIGNFVQVNQLLLILSYINSVVKTQILNSSNHRKCGAVSPLNFVDLHQSDRQLLVHRTKYLDRQFFCLAVSV